jgi:acetyl esterase/lipase
VPEGGVRDRTAERGIGSWRGRRTRGSMAGTVDTPTGHRPTPTVWILVPPPRPAARTAFPTRTRAAEQFTDLPYASGSSAQVLDLFLPGRAAGTAAPLVIDIHGGGFQAGDKVDPTGRLDALRRKGYAVASLNYRLSGEARFPAGVQDVKAAVRWLRAHAERHRVDPERFAAWGESAGGYLAVMLGVTGDQQTVLDDDALGNASVSSAVQAVVDWYGPCDFLTMDAQAVDPGGCPDAPQRHDDAGSPESRWLGAPIQTVPDRAVAANPISYLAAARTLPPFLVAHGRRDCLVPHGQSVELVAALRERGASVGFTLLDDAGHGGPRFDQEMQASTISFLDRSFGRR